MKRFIILAVLIPLLILSVVSLAWTPLGVGVQPQVRTAITELRTVGGLPFIRGTWYYVDPTSGSATAGGRTLTSAVNNISVAYTKCVSGAGDGIAIISRGTTSAATTSYLSATIIWSKHGITVFGICSGSMYNQRARISNKSFTAGDAVATHALPMLIDVTGNNNSFYNISIVNYGDSVVAIGALRVTGERNYFNNVHIMGHGNTTPATATTAYDLYLSGSENTFDRCTFGTNSVLRAAANANIVLDGPVGQCFFNDCHIMSYSATSGHGAIKTFDSTAITGWIVFRNCTFVNFRESKGAALTSLVIGSNQNNIGILIHNCSMVGWSAWNGNAGDDYVFVGSSAVTATGAGGIASTQ